MREILYRGKRKDNGEWMYGYLVIADERYFIATYPECITSLYYPDDIYTFTSFVEVIPSTIGQYTGLTDKNDARIFEGDIVTMPAYQGGKKKAIVYFKNGKFAVDGSNYNFKDICPKKMEVIGNIHDSSELLKGDVDNA